MNIFVAIPGHPEAIAELKRLTKDDELWLATPGALSDADRRAFLEAEIAFGDFPVDLLEAATRLRWIQFNSIGVESHVAIPWSKLGRIVCTNLRGVCSDPMAQTALGGILALNRGIDQLVRLQDRRDWQKSFLHPRLHVLRGARVLLLGYGTINRRVQELLRPFACSFVTYARVNGELRTPAELDAELPVADVICAALPDTPATRGLLDAQRISRMKKDAIFVNLGRGNLTDEVALVSALHGNRLRGAVIDVTVREPLPPEDPLWTSPRTILTQHTSAGALQLVLSGVGLFAENLERYRTGQPLTNTVDWAVGY